MTMRPEQHNEALIKLDVEAFKPFTPQTTSVTPDVTATLTFNKLSHTN